jgi:hypothetical protein
MLVYDHLADQLLVTQAENHNDLAIQGATPLLVVVSGNTPTTSSIRTIVAHTSPTGGTLSTGMMSRCAIRRSARVISSASPVDEPIHPLIE